MLVTVEGIVIGRRSAGDSSCFIDVLTDEFGVIEATAHGIKKLTSKNAGACTLFSYSKFCFAKTGVRYTLNSAEPKYSFHGLSADLEQLSLAVYFADVLKAASAPEQSAQGYLRFMAVTLYELEKRRVPDVFIKAAFELHICVMLGFAPDLRACRECAGYEREKMFFDYDAGNIICSDCAEKNSTDVSALSPLDTALLYAMRHIVFSPTERVYKLDTDKNTLNKLSPITEKYLLKTMDRGFKSLTYYKEITQTRGNPQK